MKRKLIVFEEKRRIIVNIQRVSLSAFSTTRFRFSFASVCTMEGKVRNDISNPLFNYLLLMLSIRVVSSGIHLNGLDGEASSTWDYVF